MSEADSGSPSRLGSRSGSVSELGTGSTLRDWDAGTYDRISEPQLVWAREQLERLELTGDEVVLDAGCGSGRVTLELVQRVPRGRVYAVDASASMVAHARSALAERATVLCQDLIDLDLPEELKKPFVDRVLARVGEPVVLEYVRLNMGGVRG